jgi:hypothetical protein
MPNCLSRCQLGAKHSALAIFFSTTFPLARLSNFYTCFFRQMTIGRVERLHDALVKIALVSRARV